MKALTLNVSGMTRNGCARSVQTALTRIDGVRRVDVVLKHQAARLVTEAAVSTDDLILAVQAAGYDASAGDGPPCG